MRLQRVVLRNFRGVVESEVKIAAEGVTVIQGPNEVGKSSIAEAINNLLDELDSSSRGSIKATKPVNRDVGPEVEVDLSTGPYSVTYAKRWLSKPMTTLTIHKPKAEQLTGRDAHNRMRTILEETLDETLWAALRYQQGQSVSQAALGDSRTLSAALDASASGGALGGDDEDGLWSRIKEHRLEFVTPAGRKSGARLEMQDTIDTLTADVERIEHELTGMEAAAERHRALGLALADISKKAVEQEQLVAGYQAAVAGIRAKQQELAELGVKAKESALAAREAATAQEARDQLVKALQDARDAHATLLEEDEVKSKGATVDQTAKAAAAADMEAFAGVFETAERQRAVARADQEHCRNVLDCEQLKERLDRVQAAQADQTAAQTFLDSCLISPEKTARVQDAVVALRTANAGLEGGTVRLQVHALKDLTVSSEGEQTTVSSADNYETEVAGEKAVTLEGIAELTVTAGAAQQELADSLAEAERRLGDACKAAGVNAANAVAEANEAERRREQAVEAIARAGGVLADNLRDLTPELMAEKIERLEERITSYLAERSSDIPMPDNLDRAKEASEQADAAVEASAKDLEKRRKALSKLEAKLGELEHATIERRVNIEAAEGRIKAAEGELNSARETTPDNVLASTSATATAEAEKAQATYDEQAEELSAQDPDAAIALLENSEAVLAALGSQTTETETERTALRTELDVRGEAGLHDKLAKAQTELEHRTREQDQTERRARAAELLYEITKAKRDEARRAYAAPFRTRLEDLARIVFGPSTTIEVDHDDLKVASRTLNGITVPYGSLSVGAREQICVLSRLACACLVATGPEADAQGAPLIFDDALGNSDPQRLERLGAVFNTAGRQAQIIVLTCDPDRYRNVGSASVVRLETVQA